MENLLVTVEKMVLGVDSANAEYIFADGQFESQLRTAERFSAKGDETMVNFIIDELKGYAEKFDSINLTPANIKVGDGVTMHLWSDAHAGTVIKKTKTTVTVQRDIATLDPNWKPEFIAGGFAGHCTNQSEQVYTYEQDPEGETITFTWSKKKNRFINGKRSISLSKGKREYYDYNF